jgi:ABC-2 type transport system permease protein
MNAEPHQSAGAERSLPGALGAGWLLARLFLRLALGRRRSLWLGLALLVPVGLAVWWRLADSGSGLGFFLELSVNVLLQFYVLGLCLYLGVAAVRDEVEDRTIVYLFARPISRWVILAAKFAAVVVSVFAALALVAILIFLVAVSADGWAGLSAGVGRLAQVGLCLALACLAYTALFGLVGVLFTRPMIPAILLAFGWEGLAANLPGGFPRASLMFYIKSLLGLGPESSGLLSLLIPSIPPASLSTAAAVLLGAAATMLAIALGLGGRKEFSR